MTRRWLLIAALATAGTCLTPADAVATIPRPARSYTIVTGGGQYIFVMIGPLGWPYYDDNASLETAAIRASYPKSGMYRNDGSATLLWAFGEPNSYVFRDQLAVYPDGIHLVIHGRAVENLEHSVLILQP